MLLKVKKRKKTKEEKEINRKNDERINKNRDKKSNKTYTDKAKKKHNKKLNINLVKEFYDLWKQQYIKSKSFKDFKRDFNNNLENDIKFFNRIIINIKKHYLQYEISSNISSKRVQQFHNQCFFKGKSVLNTYTENPNKLLSEFQTELNESLIQISKNYTKG